METRADGRLTNHRVEVVARSHSLASSSSSSLESLPFIPPTSFPEEWKCRKEEEEEEGGWEQEKKKGGRNDR